MVNTRKNETMINQYSFGVGFRCKTPAQVVGQVCEMLESTVGLTPEALVEASRPEDAPVHDEFEWDDAKAGELYRIDHARYLIRGLRVTVAKVEPEQSEVKSVKVQAGDATTRAFSSLRKGQFEPKSVYEKTTTMLADKDKREILLYNAKEELRWFRTKYSQLTELSAVFKAIDDLCN